MFGDIIDTTYFHEYRGAFWTPSGPPLIHAQALGAATFDHVVTDFIVTPGAYNLHAVDDPDDEPPTDKDGNELRRVRQILTYLPSGIVTPDGGVTPLGSAPLMVNRQERKTWPHGVTVIMGASGAGKTVWARVMSRMLNAVRYIIGEPVAGSYQYHPVVFAYFLAAAVGLVTRPLGAAAALRLPAVPPSGPVFIDSLRVDVLYGTILGSGGVARDPAAYLSALDQAARIAGRSLFITYNPLAATPAALEAAFDLMDGSVAATVITTSVALKTHGIVTIEGNTRIRPGVRTTSNTTLETTPDMAFGA
jgi:hypothetical protein